MGRPGTFEKGDARAGSKGGIANFDKNRPWREAIRRAILADDGKKLRKIAETLLDKAAEGDVAAIRELGDRIDGRSIQQIEAKVEGTIRITVDDANL